MAPTAGSYWNTLGVAHYRAGDWAEAVDALEESMRLRSGGDPYDWLFLAMARRRLGDAEAARRWLDRSLAWIEAQCAPQPGADPIPRRGPAVARRRRRSRSPPRGTTRVIGPPGDPRTAAFAAVRGLTGHRC